MGIKNGRDGEGLSLYPSSMYVLEYNLEADCAEEQQQ